MKKMKKSELKKTKKKNKNETIQKEKEKEWNEEINEEIISKSQYQDDNNKKVDIKADTTDYKFRLSFHEWIEIKRKQQMIFNQIKKIKEEEDKKMEIINMKIDKKYNEIKKNEERLDNKNKEFLKLKFLKLKKKNKIELNRNKEI